MSAPQRYLLAVDHRLRLGGEPWLMGIVNATPDSFSDTGPPGTLEDRVERAALLVAAGARIIDVGGESGVTDRPAVEAEAEIERVVPVIAGIREHIPGVLISVDTYKPPVAQAAIEAGASMVNDVSGLPDPELAGVCARSGAALVLMHTRAAPKQKLLDRSFDGRVLQDVFDFLRERIGVALEAGVAFEQLVLDPGPDFAKTPAQTVEVLRGLGSLEALGRPLLLAVSRKDFVGALTGRRPRARLAGTLAAVGHGVSAGVHILRVHDVAEVSDYLAVRAALEGSREVDPGLELAAELRREPRA